MSRFLLLIALSIGPLAGADSGRTFRQAMRLYQQKKYQESYAVLNQLTQVQPKKALYWFNLGNAAFMTKNYTVAESSFAQVIRLRSPMTPAAWLYRAKALKELGNTSLAGKILNYLIHKKTTLPGIRDVAAHDLLTLDTGEGNVAALDLYRQGKYRRALRELHDGGEATDNDQLLKALILIKLERQDRAQPILKKLEASASNSPQMHDLVSVLLARIQDVYSKPKWLFLEGTTGYDDNVRRTGSARSGRGIFNFDAGAGLRFWSKDLWMLSGGYLGRWNEVFREPDLRVYSHEAQASLAYALGTDLFLFTPFLIHESWENRPARWARGARLHLRTGNERQEFGLSAEWEFDSSLDSNNSYVAGTQTQVRLYAGRLYFPIYTQAFVDFEKVATGDQELVGGGVVPLAHFGWGPGLRLLWKMSPKWALDVNTSFHWRDYRLARHDRELNSGLRLNRLYRDGLTVYVAISRANDSSTLAAENFAGAGYDRLQFLTGAIWDVF
jgi:tetratricopeptide (TPR) repeat protein